MIQTQAKKSLYRIQVEFQVWPILIKFSLSEFDSFSAMTGNEPSQLKQSLESDMIINSLNLFYESNGLNLNWKLSLLTKWVELQQYISARLVHKLSQLSMKTFEIAWEINLDSLWLETYSKAVVFPFKNNSLFPCRYSKRVVIVHMTWII